MIVFRTGAGAGKGWGHLVRSLAIADEVQRMGAATAFVLDGEPGPAAVAGVDRHRVIALTPAASEPSATAAAVRELGARVVLLDGYALGDPYEQALSAQDVFVATLDDFGHSPHRWARLIVNSNLHYSAQPALYAQCRPDARLLLGPQYAPLRRDIVARRVAPRATRERIGKVLVILGGSDAGSSLAPVLQMLKDQLPEDAQVTVAGVQPAGETPGPARIRWVRSPAEVASEMADADLGISAGGMASYELACLGVPALLLPATGEELPVSLELQALGAAVCLRLPGEWTCATLAHEFRQLAHSRPLRESMSAKGRSIFDGLGANRIATALVAALEAPAPAA